MREQRCLRMRALAQNATQEQEQTRQPDAWVSAGLRLQNLLSGIGYEYTPLHPSHSALRLRINPAPPKLPVEARM